MRSIKIISVPYMSHTPFFARAGWLGLTIPLLNQTEESVDFSGNPEGCYFVSKDVAIRLLREKGRTRAMLYWQNTIGKHLSFGSYDCEIIESED